jgi:gliding motility-associated-like protein
MATVYLVVIPTNDAPIALDDINTTFKDTPVSGNLLTNDHDPDGDQLIIQTTPATLPANGTVVIRADGTYTYTPKPGFTGTDNFVYEVCDNATPPLCDKASVNIKVIDVTVTTLNHPPVALNDAYQGSVGLTVKGSVLNNDYDIDDNLNSNSVTLVGAAPAQGSLTLNPDGTFEYKPAPGFIGQVSFQYRVCDSGTPSLCDQAKVNIDMIANPTGNSTFATDDTFFEEEDKAILGNVLSNDYDPQGDQQAVSTTPVSAPAHGSLVLKADGTFTFTPAANYTGHDQFVYQVCDNGSPTACDMATVYLVIIRENDIPVAEDDAITVSEDVAFTGSVATNDHESKDGGNSWTLVKPPGHGSVVMNQNGSFIYTPYADFNGNDSFTYNLCDIDAECDGATVKITVSAIDDMPDAVEDTYTLNLDGILNEDVSTNDLPSGDGGNIWSIVTAPANGILVFNADGTFTYTPNVNFNGSDQFTYQLCDADKDCDQVKVTVRIEDVILPNQIITPNGDGQNDTFIIGGIEFYPNNRLTVFNRWGNEVYQKSGYLNDWDGFSNKSKVGSTALPVGTYYYILDYGNQKHKTGYVYLER